MATKSEGYGISKVEAATIRSQLKLRRNDAAGTYEVWTTAHGSGYFKWFTISQEVCAWYMKTFGITHLEASVVYVQEDGTIRDNFQPTAN